MSTTRHPGFSRTALPALVLALFIACACAQGEQSAATPPLGAPASPPEVSAATPLVVGAPQAPAEASGPVLPLSYPAGEVVKLTKAGVKPTVILAYVETYSSPYNLSADDLVHLHQQGVAADVIGAMVRRSAELRARATPVAPAIPAAPAPPPQPPPAPAPVTPTLAYPQIVATPYPGYSTVYAYPYPQYADYVYVGYPYSYPTYYGSFSFGFPRRVSFFSAPRFAHPMGSARFGGYRHSGFAGFRSPASFRVGRPVGFGPRAHVPAAFGRPGGGFRGHR